MAASAICLSGEVNDVNVSVILVLSGNTLPETADLMIAASGIIPTYIAESIAT